MGQNLTSATTLVTVVITGTKEYNKFKVNKLVIPNKKIL